MLKSPKDCDESSLETGGRYTRDELGEKRWWMEPNMDNREFQQEFNLGR